MQSPRRRKRRYSVDGGSCSGGPARETEIGLVTMKIFASSIKLVAENEVDPQDIIDAISTIKPEHKLSTQIPAPGQGPNWFLDWANEELLEAKGAKDEPTALRKFYNAAVYSKGAVECLIDWYLSKLLLNFTIPPFAGIAQKLAALDSENLLSISFSLFSDIVFEPRNRGIHRFELVEEKEAVHGYELARLTVKNCVHQVRPSDAPASMLWKHCYLHWRRSF